MSLQEYQTLLPEINNLSLWGYPFDVNSPPVGWNNIQPVTVDITVSRPTHNINGAPVPIDYPLDYEIIIAVKDTDDSIQIIDTLTANNVVTENYVFNYVDNHGWMFKKDADVHVYHRSKYSHVDSWSDFSVHSTPILHATECEANGPQVPANPTQHCQYSTCVDGVQTAPDLVYSPMITIYPRYSDNACPTNTVVTCPDIACDMDCVLDNPQPWTQWSSCSTNCANGTRTKSYTINQHPHGSGETCESHFRRVIDSGHYDNFSSSTSGDTFTVTSSCLHPSCVQDCDIDMSPVSHRCETYDCAQGEHGTGLRWNVYNIRAQPSYGGKDCLTVATENNIGTNIQMVGSNQIKAQTTNTCSYDQYRSATGQICSPTNCVLDGSWSGWSSCDVNCINQTGNKTRTRNISLFSQFGGSSCETVAHSETSDPHNQFSVSGNTITQTQSCTGSQVCRQDCVLGSWNGGWSSCDQSCGPGKQTRQINISQHPQGTGALSCRSVIQSQFGIHPDNVLHVREHYATVQQDCNNGACPVNCDIDFGTSNSACESYNCSQGESGDYGRKWTYYDIRARDQHGGTNCLTTGQNHLGGTVEHINDGSGRFGQGRVRKLSSCNYSEFTASGNSCPPQNCINGRWVNIGDCVEQSNRMQQQQRWYVDSPAAFGGRCIDDTNAPRQENETRMVDCQVTVDCDGYWATISDCYPLCKGGNYTQNYVIRNIDVFHDINNGHLEGATWNASTCTNSYGDERTMSCSGRSDLPDQCPAIIDCEGLPTDDTVVALYMGYIRFEIDFSFGHNHKYVLQYNGKIQNGHQESGTYDYDVNGNPGTWVYQGMGTPSTVSRQFGRLRSHVQDAMNFKFNGNYINFDQDFRFVQILDSNGVTDEGRLRWTIPGSDLVRWWKKIKNRWVNRGSVFINRDGIGVNVSDPDTGSTIRCNIVAPYAVDPQA
jgi:hypothetical protein